MPARHAQAADDYRQRRGDVAASTDAASREFRYDARETNLPLELHRFHRGDRRAGGVHRHLRLEPGEADHQREGLGRAGAPLRHQWRPAGVLAYGTCGGRLARLRAVAALQRAGHYPGQSGLGGGQDARAELREPRKGRVPPRPAAAVVADGAHPADRPHPPQRRPAAPGRRPCHLDLRAAEEGRRPQRHARAILLEAGHRRDRLRQGQRHPR